MMFLFNWVNCRFQLVNFPGCLLKQKLLVTRTHCKSQSKQDPISSNSCPKKQELVTEAHQEAQKWNPIEQ